MLLEDFFTERWWALNPVLYHEILPINLWVWNLRGITIASCKVIDPLKTGILPDSYHVLWPLIFEMSYLSIIFDLSDFELLGLTLEDTINLATIIITTIIARAPSRYQRPRQRLPAQAKLSTATIIWNSCKKFILYKFFLLYTIFMMYRIILFLQSP